MKNFLNLKWRRSQPSEAKAFLPATRRFQQSLKTFFLVKAFEPGFPVCCGCLLWAAFKTPTTQLHRVHLFQSLRTELVIFVPRLSECLTSFSSSTPDLGKHLEIGVTRRSFLPSSFAQALPQSAQGACGLRGTVIVSCGWNCTLVSADPCQSGITSRQGRASS